MPGGTTRERWTNCGELTLGSVSVNNLKSVDFSDSGALIEDSAEDDSFGRTHVQVIDKKTDIVFTFADVAAALSIRTLYWETGLATSCSFKKYKAQNAGSAADKTCTVGPGQLLVKDVRIPSEHKGYTLPQVTCAVMSDSDGEGSGASFA